MKNLRAIAKSVSGARMGLCLHQAEAVRRLIGPNATVEIGAISLVLGRDQVSPLELKYDPREIPGEWHAWVRVGGTIVDPSVQALHQQVRMLFGATEYLRLRPFLGDVLVAKPFQIKPSRYTPLGLEDVYQEFLNSPGDMEVVEGLTRKETR